MAGQRDVGLLQPQRPALGEGKLLGDDVDAGDGLGYRVLDLDARVDLEEVEVATACAGGVGVDEELDRARPPVAEPLAERDRRRPQAFPQPVVQAGRGRLLDELLVAPLHRAVPVAQVDDVLAVPEELHFDVPSPLDVPLQVHAGIAERGLRLRAGDRDRLRELRRVRHDPQPPPAAAAGGLDQHGVPDPLRDRRRRDRRAGTSRSIPRVSPRAGKDVTAGEDGEPGGGRVLAGGQLVPGSLKGLGPRPDEHDPRRRAGARQPRVLRQEPVTGMDRVRARRDGRGHDRADVQVAGGRGGWPDPDDPVREPGGQRLRVRVGDREHGFDAKPLAGTDHPDGDLPPVSDEHPAQHAGPAHVAASASR